jgi:hypothetical protein
MREVRLEERLRGFYDCLQVFEDLWRAKANARMKRGISIKDAFGGAECGLLWEGIEKAQKLSSPIDSEYKALMIPRVYPDEPSAVDQLAEVARG